MRWSSRRWATPTRRRWRPLSRGRAGYVGLVASARRAAVVLGGAARARLGEDALARVRSPAGLDLGPATQPEIAVAILAELVAWRHTRRRQRAVLLEAVDPVCGMTVAVEAAGDAVVFEGVSYYFCCAGCRSRFEAEPARYGCAAEHLSRREIRRSLSTRPPVWQRAQ